MGNSDLVGRTLGGRYQIQSLIGQGAMASVYMAYDTNLHRAVAIKVIHQNLSNNPEFIRRFEEEATAVAQLRHPNIIQVFDFTHDGDLYYMVMEFVMGETLQSRLKRLNVAKRRLNVREIITFAVEICEAADYAHQRGMIHRDIKPANIMLDVHGKAILMDFGIARMVGASQPTIAGTILGTARYMSPEQIQGLQIDARADIYSIGVTLFEMLSGKPPFEADSAMTLMMMHLNDPVPDLHELEPDTPPDLIAITNKALEKSRDKRYQSASEMADVLRKVPDKSPITPAVVSRAISAEDTFIEPAVMKDTGETAIEAPGAISLTKETSQPMMPVVEPPAPITEVPAPVVEAPAPITEVPAPVIAVPTLVTQAAETPKEKVEKPSAPEITPIAEIHPVKIPAGRKKNRAWIWIVLILLILIISGGGIFIFTKLLFGGTPLFASPTTAESIAQLPETISPVEAKMTAFALHPTPSATKLPSPTPTRRPTPTITPTSTPFASLVLQDGETLLYSQDFETGKAPYWILNPGWNIINAEKGEVLQGRGHVFAHLYQGPWKDYSLRFRLKLNQPNSMLHANIRHQGRARYFIGFNRYQIYLSRQDQDDSFHDLAYRDTSLGTGWHDIEIDAYGGLITVYVDGKKYLSYTDPQPLTSGRVSFESLTPEIVWIDDVAIIEKPQP